MKHRVFINDKHQIELVFAGDVSRKDMHKILVDLHDFANELSEKGSQPDVIYDMTAIKTADPAIAHLAYHGMRNLEFRRCAIYGMNRAINALATFAINLSGESERVKLFDSRSQALKWLATA